MNKTFVKKTPTGWEPWKEITPSTKLLIEAAEKYGVQWQVIPDSLIVEFSNGSEKRYITEQIPDTTTYLAYYATEDKVAAKALLEGAGISTPRGFAVRRNDPDSLPASIFKALTAPLIVKPIYGTQGQGITTNVTTEADLKTAVKSCVDTARVAEDGALVEEQFVGDEYRVLATQEKVIAIMRRVPANVTGDGKQTIRQLVDQKNSDPRRGDLVTDILVKIKIGDAELQNLADQGLTPDSVPAANQTVFLRQNSNISTGGDSVDFTDQAHPSVKEIALQAMHAFPGLKFAGLDFMTADITKPQTKDSYRVIELNKSPGFSIHDQPYQGENRHAARELLFLLFPALKDQPIA